MTDFGECVTHHYCDCIAARLKTQAARIEKMDSCTAKLTDEHLAELNKLQGQLGMSWIERTRLESRIVELEAALERYGLHEDGCMGRIRPNECTCGLTAAGKECLRRDDAQIV